MTNGLLTLSPEGRVSAEKCVGNDTNTPDIDRLAMSNLLQDLGGNISGGSAGSHEDIVSTSKDLAQTKVRDHETSIIGLVHEEQVLRLEIAVDNIHLVQVLDTQQDLVDQTSSISFGVASLLEELVEKLSTFSQIGDQVDRILGLEQLQQRDAVGVSDLGQDRDLCVEHGALTLKRLFKDDLERI